MRGKSQKGKVSTHELGMRMWQLAWEDPAYRKALGQTTIDMKNAAETCQKFWVLGAIFSLNALAGMKFKGNSKAELKTYKVPESGEMVVSGPRIFLKLPNIGEEDNGE